VKPIEPEVGSERDRGETRQTGEICFEVTVLMVTWLELLMEVSAHFAAALWFFQALHILII
jgi:hypothetical protein